MDDQDGTRISLKIVFIISTILVVMDLYEMYFSYTRLVELQSKLDELFFENCIKYHIISQMFFTSFATFSGISAAVMSLGLILDYEYFSIKFIIAFLYMNYLIFGPYLLSACVLGYYYFGLIAYNCSSEDINTKYLNFSTVLALLICSVLSLLLTLGFSMIYTLIRMKDSIRFRPGGSYILGRLFWMYVFSRNSDSNDNNARAIPLINVQDQHVQINEINEMIVLNELNELGRDELMNASINSR